MGNSSFFTIRGSREALQAIYQKMVALHNASDALFDEGLSAQEAAEKETSLYTQEVLPTLQRLIGRGVKLTPSESFFSAIYWAFVALDSKDGNPEDGQFPVGSTEVNVVVKD